MRFRRKKSVAKKISSKVRSWIAAQEIQRLTELSSTVFGSGNNAQSASWDVCVAGDLVDYNFVQSSVGAVAMAIKAIRHQFTFVNADIKPVYIWFYPWICRKDIPSDTTVASGNSITSIIQKGFGLASGGNAANIALPYVTPFMSSNYGKYFKSGRPWRKLLYPGVPYQIRLNGVPNQKWDPVKWGGLAGNVQQVVLALKGLTKGIGVIVMGMPVNDSVATSQVRVGASKVVVEAKLHWEYVNIPNQHTWTYTNNTLAVATEQFMNPSGIAKQTGDVQA